MFVFKIVFLMGDMIKRAWRPLVFTIMSTISSKSVLKSASSQAGQLLPQCAVPLTAASRAGMDLIGVRRLSEEQAA